MTKMSNLSKFAKRHIPETITICIAVLMFSVMSAYAFFLYRENKYVGENPLDNAEEVGENDFSEFSQEVAKQEEYCIIGNGKKYHTYTCSYIKDESKCKPVSQEEIENEKYEPCSRCIKQGT